ncbi:hypothetical protein PPTG_23149 [Phytophthora nicotianae INRA-310]|uniref:Uncharacterized protein n=1 Tax=Phytophthora nicotianae (strain INRA-310) TaxID=761204 RepID=W2Q471_PHYN3|nr:hypothetical protein PPTG_23149 [Phytophthora nicotianae INRA-310]ETN07671.1 hypothetical protein PPTG_23149 [Phytophthora nicotianae INRA-310]
MADSANDKACANAGHSYRLDFAPTLPFHKVKLLAARRIIFLDAFPRNASPKYRVKVA